MFNPVIAVSEDGSLLLWAAKAEPELRARLGTTALYDWLWVVLFLGRRAVWSEGSSGSLLCGCSVLGMCQQAYPLQRRCGSISHRVDGKSITPVLLTLADNLEDPIHKFPFGTSKHTRPLLWIGLRCSARPSLGVGKLTSLFAADHTDKERNLMEENSVVPWN